MNERRLEVCERKIPEPERLKQKPESGGIVLNDGQIDFMLSEHVPHKRLSIAPDCIPAQRSELNCSVTREASNDQVLNQDHRFVDTRTPGTPHEVDRDTMKPSFELSRHARCHIRIMS